MPGDIDLRNRLARERELLIAVKVSTRASRSEVLGLGEDGSLRVKLAAVPEKGKANEELRGFVVSLLRRQQGQCPNRFGQTSTHKRIRITR